MTTLDTTLSVVQWALSGDTLKPPPEGDFQSIEPLIKPPTNLKNALAELTAVTAGRMRLGVPPVGDSSPVHASILFAAAAVGVRRTPELALRFLSFMPELIVPVDWIAGYGLIQPVLPFLAGLASASSLAEELKNRSPLTALLDYPLAGGESIALMVARRFLENRQARLFLVMIFAKPVVERLVRDWRKKMLLLFNTGTESEQNFVLDVFEAMMIHFRKEAMDQVNSARSIFNDPKAAAIDENLHDAFSIASWWQPLWAIERANIDALRSRPFLHLDYIKGLNLFKLSQQLKGGLP